VSSTDKENALRIKPSCIGLILGLTALSVWLIFIATREPERVMRALLVNFSYFTPIAAALVAWSAILSLTHATWAKDLEKMLLKGIGFSAPSLLLLAALWLGNRFWAPWSQIRPVEGNWFAPNFVFSRDLILLALFWMAALGYVSRRGRGDGRRSAGLVVAAFVLVFSLLSFDLVMGLKTPWSSALFGTYFYSTALYGAMALWIVLSLFQSDTSEAQRRDLGKLLMVMSLLSAYFMYSHVNTLWYANLPSETGFLITRTSLAPWRTLAYWLLGTVYFGPLLMLLPVEAKRNPRYLGTISLIILAGLWLERFILIMPSLQERARFGWVEIAMIVLFLGIGKLVMGRRGDPAQPDDVKKEKSL
jgi:hypothetical protein